MQTNLSSSYEEFVFKVKSKLKKQKLERKQNLRQISYNRYIESSDDQNEDEYIKKTMKRGSKWWSKINRNYFKPVSESLFSNMKTLMSSDDVLDFSSEIPLLYTYYQQILCLKNPYLFHDNSLRIVFRQQYKIDNIQKNEIVSFIVRNNEKSTKHKIQLMSSLPKNPRLSSFHTISRDFQEQKHLNNIESIDISILGRENDQQFIYKCLKYEQIWRNQYLSEIEKQIMCWEQELEEFHTKHISQWDKLENKIFDKSRRQEEDIAIVNARLQEQMEKLKKMLICNETFIYFKAGYSDKIPEELQKALEYIRQIEMKEQLTNKQSQKKNKQFDTDCKICFCTKNEATNQVMYCDDCNTSFHQSCYGVQKFDVNAPFLCDVCASSKKNSNEGRNTKADTPACQICGRIRFPIKNIDGHFYHISCLVLFNFIKIEDFEISLNEGINHERILDEVIENEVQNDDCVFCSKNQNLGMKFHCDSPLCAKSFHPICAYLNGCKFSITRNSDNTIQVSVKCREHFTSKKQELYFQVFVRRFLCNFKNTCELTEEKFVEAYIRELKEREEKSNQQNQTAIKKILKTNKNIHGYIEQRKMKESNRLTKRQSNSAKKPGLLKSPSQKEDSSEIKSMIKDIQNSQRKCHPFS